MLTSIINSEKVVKKEIFPRLMRGILTGAIYLVHGTTDSGKVYQATVLFKGKNRIDDVGDRISNDPILFEDFDGSVTISN